MAEAAPAASLASATAEHAATSTEAAPEDDITTAMAYSSILAKVAEAAARVGRPVVSPARLPRHRTAQPAPGMQHFSHPALPLLVQPRLVAVSKTKPAALLKEVYDCGQRHFGENYVQEICDKAADASLPKDINWHFIGQLQSNKAKTLVTGVPNLWMVESVDSAKLAGLLDKACAAAGRADKLRVCVQVNTSGEPQKGGVEPGHAAELAVHIRDNCPHLHLAGLMTIGELGAVASVFFERLVAERRAVAVALGVDPQQLELSMGMSGDFELAIEHGSTNVRVGSSIFGAREPKKPKTT